MSNSCVSACRGRGCTGTLRARASAGRRRKVRGLVTIARHAELDHRPRRLLRRRRPRRRRRRHGAERKQREAHPARTRGNREGPHGADAADRRTQVLRARHAREGRLGGSEAWPSGACL